MQRKINLSAFINQRSSIQRHASCNAGSRLVKKLAVGTPLGADALELYPRFLIVFGRLWTVRASVPFSTLRCEIIAAFVGGFWSGDKISYVVCSLNHDRQIRITNRLRRNCRHNFLRLGKKIHACHSWFDIWHSLPRSVRDHVPRTHKPCRLPYYSLHRHEASRTEKASVESILR